MWFTDANKEKRAVRGERQKEEGLREMQRHREREDCVCKEGGGGMKKREWGIEEGRE